MSQPDSNTDLLKLIALDESDLEIISAHCQDGIVRIEDMTYQHEQQRFILLFNRFAWEKTYDQDSKPQRTTPSFQRRRSALHFERVTNAQQLNIDASKKSDVKKLLALNFEATESPSGTINLFFSGGSEIKLKVECIETMLKDLGAIWETENRPNHDE